MTDHSQLPVTMFQAIDIDTDTTALCRVDYIMSEEEKEQVANAILTLQTAVFSQNVKMGWWDKPRELGTLLCLVHSEISEAMEGARKGLMDDHLPERKMLEVELADAIIRILDISASQGLDVGQAVIEKLAYNRTRADHQPGARAETYGKKF